MNSIVSLLFASIVVVTIGCGPPSQHPLTLVFPQNDCTHASGICLAWKGCDAIGVRWINVHVGPSPSEDTEVGCLFNSSALTFDVYYRPGKEYYLIDADYMQSGIRVEVSSGPFSEDEALTPWRLNLQ